MRSAYLVYNSFPSLSLSVSLSIAVSRLSRVVFFSDETSSRKDFFPFEGSEKRELRGDRTGQVITEDAFDRKCVRWHPFLPEGEKEKALGGTPL